MSDRQNYDMDDEWEKTEQALSTLQLNIPEPPQLITPPDPPTSDDAVDSALLNALNNPRERMILFQIEDIILKFVRSSERSMEVPPGLNSFRRLLAYRLATRFGLMHITSEQQNESGERTITFYKTPTTTVPRILLIDYNSSVVNPSVSAVIPSVPLNASERKELPASNIASRGEVNNSLAGTAAVTPVPQAENGKKVLVMKRQTSSSNNQSNKSQENKPQISAEEREKAYLEARARIFGSEEANSDGTEKTKRDSPSVTNTSSPALISEAGLVPNPICVQEIDNYDQYGKTEGYNVAATLLLKKEKLGRSSSGNSLVSPTEDVDSGGASIKRSTSNPQVQNLNHDDDRGSRRANARGKGKLVDVGSWKENKSQLRNIEAEKSDPDFVRRGSPNVPQSGTNNNSGTYTQDNVMYGASPAGYDPRQMYTSYSYDANSPHANGNPVQYNQAYQAYPGPMYLNSPYGNVPAPLNYPYPYSADGMWNQTPYDYSRGNPMIAAGAPPHVQPVYGTLGDSWQQQQPNQQRGSSSPYSRGNANGATYSRGPSVNNRQDFPPLT